MRGRFGYIDALRGMAIVAMVLYELHHHGVIVAGGFAGHLFAEGSRGIDLFFVISGFALAYPALSVLRADGRAGLDIGRYAIRRIARIVPATWITIACLAIAPGLVALAPHPAFSAFTAALPPAGAILREIFFLQPPPAAPDAFWAVAVAMRWYVLFPPLLLLWTKSQRGFLALGVAVAVLESILRLHGAGFGEIPAFMLGIVAADWRVRHFGFARWSLYLAVAAAILGVALEPIFSGPLFAAAPFGADNFGWQAAAFFLLTGIGHSKRAEEVFDRAVFATAGSVSFAIALVIEPVIAVARPFVQHLSTAGARALGRSAAPQTGGLTGRLSHALAPGTALAEGLEISFVALSVFVVGLVLYRVVDREVFERDPRMRLADRLEPLLARVFGSLRTTGVLVFGKAPEDLRFESTGNAAAAFYAPPPRGESPGSVSVTKRSGSPQDLEQEMIAAKKRLADRTTAMFADAEYEANRAKGIVTSSAGMAFPPPPPGIIDASATVYGEVRDVWQKPRAVPDAPPPAPTSPSTSQPVVFEARPDSESDARQPSWPPLPRYVAPQSQAVGPPLEAPPAPHAPSESDSLPIITTWDPMRSEIGRSDVPAPPVEPPQSAPAPKAPKRLSTSPPGARVSSRDAVSDSRVGQFPTAAEGLFAPEGLSGPKGSTDDANDVGPVDAPQSTASAEPVWNKPFARATFAEAPPHEAAPHDVAPLEESPHEHAPLDAVPSAADSHDPARLEASAMPSAPSEAFAGTSEQVDPGTLEPASATTATATVVADDAVAIEPSSPVASPPAARPPSPIRFKIGGGPPGKNSGGEKSP